MAGLTREQRAAKAAEAERLSREQELRVADEVHESYDNWDNDYLLDTTHIPAREGYVQRWIRSGIKGEIDKANIFKKMNRGWRPRPVDTVPKAQQILRMDFEGDQVIGIHGSILMEMPEALFNRQSQRVKDATQHQMSAVKNDLFKIHERDSGFSRPEFSNQTKVRRGRIAQVDD